MVRKAAQQNKNTSEELKKAYLGTVQVNKAGGGTQLYIFKTYHQTINTKLIYSLNA